MFGLKLRLQWLRCLTAGAGLCSIAWAVFAISVESKEAVLDGLAATVISGEVLSSQQLNKYNVALQSLSTENEGLSSKALFDDAVIRLRLAEGEMRPDHLQYDPHKLALLDKAISNALAGAPTSSFLWLAKSWLQGLNSRAEAQSSRYLRMSYSSGPREAWVAGKRNRVALDAFSSLPKDVSDLVPLEFAGLVSSGFYLDAASILAGPGWRFRETLMKQLVLVDNESRRRFANVLAASKIEGAIVPGIDREPSRPF